MISTQASPNIVPARMGAAEIVMKFTDYTGKFPFHCHVLEHQDNMMMSQFEVRP